MRLPERLLPPILAGKFAIVSAIPVLFGAAYIVRCDIAAQGVEQIASCWKTGGLMAGIGGAGMLGYNIPNPRLDKARHALAESLRDEPVATAPPRPPVAPFEGDEVLPYGWERDEHGRLHDEQGRYVAEHR